MHILLGSPTETLPSFDLNPKSESVVLEGFFEFLEDMEWECTSAPLPDPKASRRLQVAVWGVELGGSSQSNGLSQRTTGSGWYLGRP